jgi:hypothetical protein
MGLVAERMIKGPSMTFFLIPYCGAIVIEQALVIGRGGMIELHHLPPELRPTTPFSTDARFFPCACPPVRHKIWVLLSIERQEDVV